jgi:hypothetical protein
MPVMSTGLVRSVTFFAASQKATNSLSVQVALLLGSAVVGAILSYAVMRLNARHDPRKQLSWDARTDRGLVAVRPEIRDNVSIKYKNEDVIDLVAIKCHVVNTGNQLVRNERLRFAFPDGARILESDFAPQPEPELSASKVEDITFGSTQCAFTIGHLEVGQEVSFELIATGPNAEDWTVHPYNEDGGVLFQPREVSRIRDEQEHLTPFIVIMTLLIIGPPLLGSLEVSDYDILVAPFLFLARLVLVVLLIPHILPVARLARRVVARWLAKPEPNTSVTIQGGNPYVVASSGTVGNIRLQVPENPE